MKNLSELIAIARQKPIRKLVVVAAEDITVLKAVKATFNEGFIIPVLIGNKNNILKISEEIGFTLTNTEIINEPDPAKAAMRAVTYLNQGGGDILMKGLVGTSPFLKAVVNKDNGLRKNALLSHFALFESPNYHKLFGITDVAMNIAPSLEEKISILHNSVEIMHRLGIANPKVAVIAPVETVNEKIESTVHAAILTVMNKRQQITGCLVDGPLALDNAVSMEAARHKGIISEVAGDADILLLPELNSGNVLYKSLLFMSQASSAAIVAGAKVPIVLTSRADNEQNKILSIAFAAVLD